MSGAELCPFPGLSQPRCCRSTAASLEGLAIAALQPQETPAVLAGFASTDLGSPPQSRGLPLLR